MAAPKKASRVSEAGTAPTSPILDTAAALLAVLDLERAPPVLVRALPERRGAVGSHGPRPAVAALADDPERRLDERMSAVGARVPPGLPGTHHLEERVEDLSERAGRRASRLALDGILATQ